MYDIRDEDVETAVDMSQSSDVMHTSSLETQLPALELLKVHCSSFEPFFILQWMKCFWLL